jgi:Spy/CpxP family protein refolding chaperone
MKKIISAVAVVALSGAIAFGAIDEGAGKGWGHGGHRRGGMSAHLAQKLNLTDAQKDQMKALHRSFREDNKAFFETMRQTRQEMKAAREAGDTAKVESLKATFQSQRAQMKQLHDAQKEKFLAILTPEQRTQFDALEAERDARRQQHQQK